MMFSTLKAILLGAVLATAAPLTANTTLPEQHDLSLTPLFPEGIAPTPLAQVADPAAEVKKCRDPLPVETTGCRLKGLVDAIDNYSHAGRANHTDPVTQLFDRLTEVYGHDEARDASAHALAPRQKELCPKKCAAWAVLPPFGVWFAACMADCHLRCARGLSCP